MLCFTFSFIYNIFEFDNTDNIRVHDTISGIVTPQAPMVALDFRFKLLICNNIYIFSSPEPKAHGEFIVYQFEKRYCPFFSVVLDGILFILTGIDDIHKSLDEFEILPDPTTVHRVSCP